MSRKCLADRWYIAIQNFKFNFAETLLFSGFETITFEPVNGFTYFIFLNKENSLETIPEKQTENFFFQVITKKISSTFIDFEFFII